MKHNSLLFIVASIPILVSLVVGLHQYTIQEGLKNSATPNTLNPPPLPVDIVVSHTSRINCSISTSPPPLYTSIDSNPSVTIIDLNYSSPTTTTQPIYTSPPPLSNIEESHMASINCSIQGIPIELRVYIRVIRDRELLEGLKDSVEKYAKSILEKGYNVPDETLRLLDLLGKPIDKIGLLEVTVELVNRGDKSIRIEAGPICGSILDKIVEDITGRREPHKIGFARLSLTPIKGAVSSGEGLYCITIVYTETLQPGESMHNIYYYVIEKPSVNEYFEAVGEVSVVGFGECSLIFKVTY